MTTTPAARRLAVDLALDGEVIELSRATYDGDELHAIGAALWDRTVMLREKLRAARLDEPGKIDYVAHFGQELAAAHSALVKLGLRPPTIGEPEPAAAAGETGPNNDKEQGARTMSTAMTTRREWSVLRPADSDFLPLTPIGPPFCSTFDEGYARQAAVRTFSNDVLAECPLAWSDVTETEFTVVGLALSAEKENGQ